MSDRQHSVVIHVGGRVLEAIEYRVDTDLLSPTDAFSLTFPYSRDIYEAVSPDGECEVYLDDVRVLSGFIDRRNDRLSKGEGRIVVTGRDRAGRLVDESMPPGAIGGLKVQQFAEKCVTPWFTSVTLSNAENRRHLRGSGSNLRKVVREPTSALDAKDKAKHLSIIQKGKAPGATKEQQQAAVESEIAIHVAANAAKASNQVQPGQSRWQTLSSFLEDTGLLAWSTNDGKAFFVGQPNYDQPPTYRFFQAAPGSDRSSEQNVLDWDAEDSTENRYSKITVYGTGKGDGQKAGKNLKYQAVIKNNWTKDGSGIDFRRGKELIVHDGDIQSQADAEERARREMGERDAHGRVINIVVPGHRQSLDGGKVWHIYALDHMAEVENERSGLKGQYMLTSVAFTGSKSGGARTQIRLHPKGALLR